MRPQTILPLVLLLDAVAFCSKRPLAVRPGKPRDDITGISSFSPASISFAPLKVDFSEQGGDEGEENDEEVDEENDEEVDEENDEEVDEEDDEENDEEAEEIDSEDEGPALLFDAATKITVEEAELTQNSLKMPVTLSRGYPFVATRNIRFRVPDMATYCDYGSSRWLIRGPEISVRGFTFQVLFFPFGDRDVTTNQVAVAMELLETPDGGPTSVCAAFHATLRYNKHIVSQGIKLEDEHIVSQRFKREIGHGYREHIFSTTKRRCRAVYLITHNSLQGILVDSVTVDFRLVLAECGPDHFGWAFNPAGIIFTQRGHENTTLCMQMDFDLRRQFEADDDAARANSQKAFLIKPFVIGTQLRNPMHSIGRPGLHSSRINCPRNAILQVLLSIPEYPRLLMDVPTQDTPDFSDIRTLQDMFTRMVSPTVEDIVNVEPFRFALENRDDQQCDTLGALWEILTGVQIDRGYHSSARVGVPPGESLLPKASLSASGALASLHSVRVRTINRFYRQSSADLAFPVVRTLSSNVHVRGGLFLPLQRVIQQHRRNPTTGQLEFGVRQERITTLTGSLDAFIGLRIIYSNDAFVGSDCLQNSYYTKVDALPAVLPLMLGYYDQRHITEFDGFVGMPVTRGNDFFSYPLEHDFSILRTEPDVDLFDDSNAMIFPPPDAPPMGPQMYDLSGVIVHSGPHGKGRYYAFAKIRNTWFRFDDADIYKVDQRQVLQDNFGGPVPYRDRGMTPPAGSTLDSPIPNGPLRSNVACMLFYTRRGANLDARFAWEHVPAAIRARIGLGSIGSVRVSVKIHGDRDRVLNLPMSTTVEKMVTRVKTALAARSPPGALIEHFEILGLRGQCLAGPLLTPALGHMPLARYFGGSVEGSVMAVRLPSPVTPLAALDSCYVIFIHRVSGKKDSKPFPMFVSRDKVLSPTCDIANSLRSRFRLAAHQPMFFFVENTHERLVRLTSSFNTLPVSPEIIVSTVDLFAGVACPETSTKSGPRIDKVIGSDIEANHMKLLVDSMESHPAEMESIFSIILPPISKNGGLHPDDEPRDKESGVEPKSVPTIFGRAPSECGVMAFDPSPAYWGPLRFPSEKPSQSSVPLLLKKGQNVKWNTPVSSISVPSIVSHSALYRHILATLSSFRLEPCSSSILEVSMVFNDGSHLIIERNLDAIIAQDRPIALIEFAFDSHHVVVESRSEMYATEQIFWRSARLGAQRFDSKAVVDKVATWTQRQYLVDFLDRDYAQITDIPKGTVTVRPYEIFAAGSIIGHHEGREIIASNSGYVAQSFPPISPLLIQFDADKVLDKKHLYYPLELFGELTNMIEQSFKASMQLMESSSIPVESVKIICDHTSHLSSKHAINQNLRAYFKGLSIRHVCIPSSTSYRAMPQHTCFAPSVPLIISKKPSHLLAPRLIEYQSARPLSFILHSSRLESGSTIFFVVEFDEFNGIDERSLLRLRKDAVNRALLNNRSSGDSFTQLLRQISAPFEMYRPLKPHR